MSIVFLTASAYAQLGTPTCVSPKLGFGCYGIYQAPRVPTFSWTPVTGATWYLVWISEGATPSTAVILQWVENGTSWTPDNEHELSPGTGYSWWVRAWNTGGVSSWSKKANFTVGQWKYMAINANAFVPYEDGYDYTREYAGGGLRPNNSTSNEWCAPVNLPHGAKVSSVRLYYYNSGSVVTASQCWLYRSAYDSIDRQEMGHCTADTSSGYHFWNDSSIGHDIIDNINYSYFLRVDLPSSSNRLIHVLICYWD